jgi:hypothetical protein
VKNVQTVLHFMCAASTIAVWGLVAGSTEAEAATAVKLAGKYYYRTDHFSEDCSAGHLSVQTSWANDASAWTSIKRGQVKYVKPAQAPNGSFEWHCGNVLVNGSDYSECNNSPADYVRIYWSPKSDRIDMQCFNFCGKGSSPADCAPY